MGRHAVMADLDDIEEDGLDSPKVRSAAEREDALVEAKRVRRWRPSAKERERLAWWKRLLANEGVDLT